jgi:dephospho-CoA kinase
MKNPLRQAQVRPCIIGLTGSIAMGKSTVAAMFEDEGVPVFDADAAVHILQGPGGNLVAGIEAAFPGTTGPQGVDRQLLGKAVWGDTEKLRELEAIVHPAVAAMRNDFLIENADKEMIVFDIPLLFEKGGHQSVDHIVVVSAPADQQRSRALARPDMTIEKFEHILKLQMPDAEKRERAHSVIETGGSISDTRKQVHALIKKVSRALADSDK